MELALIPCFAISTENDFVSDIIAPLEAAYADSSAKPIWPTIDPRFTTDPWILFFIQNPDIIWRIEKTLKNLHQIHFLVLSL